MIRWLRVALELLAKSQFQARLERGQLGFGLEGGHRQKQPDRLGLHLAVEEQRLPVLLPALLVVVAPLAVSNRGGRLRRANHAAVAADGEAVLGNSLAGRRELPPGAVPWPEIDLPQSDLLQVLEAEGTFQSAWPPPQFSGWMSMKSLSRYVRRSRSSESSEVWLRR